MQIGIIGLPSSGKSTVFNALTGAKIPTSSFGRRDEPNLAVVRVPDSRVDQLVPLFNPRKTVYATVEFVDIGGLKGTGSGGGAGFSPAFLAAARQLDAFAMVLDAFSPAASPSADLEELELELNLADLSVIEKRLERLDADVKKGPVAARPQLEKERELLARLAEALHGGKPIRALEIAAEDERVLRGFGFLTAKHAFVILNMSDDALRAGEPLPELGLPLVPVAGAIEAEIAELDPEDAVAFLTDLGVSEPGIDRVIRLAYETAKLRSFFTVGPDEVRAWTITAGATAVEAAAVIHTDLARGFIRAEVISYEDMLRTWSLAEARRQGVLRLEGKTYVVQDGEICHFLSNV